MTTDDDKQHEEGEFDATDGSAINPRLSCPCGFRGNTRNIRQHRVNCPAWLGKAKAPDDNGVDTARASAGAMRSEVTPESDEVKPSNDRSSPTP